MVILLIPCYEKEILKWTDWYTDDLFYSNEDHMILAEFSRIFCDAERFAGDSLNPRSFTSCIFNSISIVNL